MFWSRGRVFLCDTKLYDGKKYVTIKRDVKPKNIDKISIFKLSAIKVDISMPITVWHLLYASIDDFYFFVF